MFGKAGLGGLMKQAQQMQENMKKAQAELAQTEVEGQAGNGLVKVTATCSHVVRKSASARFQSREAADDPEMLEDSSSPPSTTRTKKAKPPLPPKWCSSPKACPQAWAISSNKAA